MNRSRNLLPLAGFLLCAAAFVSYPLFFSRFPVTRDVPWLTWLLLGLGVAMAGVGLARAYRRPERYRGKVAGPVFGVLSLAVVGLFVALLGMTRQLPTSEGAPKVGQKAPDFTLPDTQGRSVRLYDLLAQPAAGRSGSWVLLIFYRGYW
jgi:hypothetical protein